MLPTFRVRGVRPVDDPSSTRAKVAADGVIRLKKEDYDELLKHHPEAALRYLDEDDDEIILVGSSFELDQRLKEPVRVDAVADVNAHPQPDTLHTFEVKRQPDVIGAWRCLDALTQSAQERTCRASIIEGKKKMMCIGNDGTSDNRSQVRFGQASPLSLNAPITSNIMSKAISKDDEHINRWSSYVALPSSFDQKPHDLHKTLEQADTNKTELHVKAMSTESSNRTSLPVDLFPFDAFLNNDISGSMLKTILGKDEPKMKQSINLVDLQTDSEKLTEKHQPLMKMFEAELQKLATSTACSNSAGVQTISTVSKSKNASTSTDECLKTNPDNVASTSSSPNVDSMSAGEICVLSIQSIINGLSLLTSGLAGSDLKRTVDNVLPQINEMKDKIVSCTDEVNRLTNTVLPQLPTMKVDSENAEQMRKRVELSSDTSTNITQSRPLNPSQVTPAQQLWKVERVIGKRFIQYNSESGPRIVQYLVRWVGCGPSDDMWYDEENLLDCREIIEKFESELVRGHQELKHQTRPNIGNTQSRYTEAQDAALLHIRTAGDGMVVWKERCEPGGVGICKSSPLKEARVSFADHSHANLETVTASSATADGHLRRVTTPCNTSRTAEQHKELRHRASWHTVSSNVDRAERNFDFSRCSITNKDASIGQLPKRRSLAPAHSHIDQNFLKTSLLEPRKSCSMLFNPVLSTSPSPADWWTWNPQHTLRRSASTIESTIPRKKGILKPVGFRDSYEVSPAASPKRNRSDSTRFKSIRECASAMMEMGYTKSQAETAAIQAKGDILEAIDILEDDRKAWERDTQDAIQPQSARPNEPLPGSWDEELYG